MTTSWLGTEAWCAADSDTGATERFPAAWLRIEPQGWLLPARPEQTLFEAAQAACVRLPSSCRNGTCRACMCRLLAGTVRYRIEWPGLSREEKTEGWILPCVALAQGDVVIEAPGAQPWDAPR